MSRPLEAAPSGSLLPLVRGRTARNRLLAPQHVARLVRDQDHVYAVEFALDFGRLYCAATDDARAARPSMGLGDAVDGGQAALEEPSADLASQLIV